MEYHFKNLVFEGDGVKGIAYIGALEELRKRGILSNIERVGGASASAINAILIGLNFSREDIKKILIELDFNDFMDDSSGMVRDTARLIEKYGWFKGDFFRKWIGDIIKQKTGNSESTFNDIRKEKLEKGFKDIYLLGTNLSTGTKSIFL